MQIYCLPKDFENTMSQLQPKIKAYAYKYNLAYQHLFKLMIRLQRKYDCYFNQTSKLNFLSASSFCQCQNPMKEYMMWHFIFDGVK